MEIPSEMKALMKEAEVESYSMVTIPVPEPVGDEVLIRVDAVSICGSDIALYKWTETAKVIAEVPFVPGHEYTGTVVKLGPESNLKIGDRIAVENHMFCGDCYQCKTDRGDICQKMSQYGHGKGTQYGGFSQYTAVNTKYAYKIEGDISVGDAVLMEPMGVAHNAMERLEPSGEAVLIIGAGAIGLFGCSIAKAMGATKVLIVDIDEKRLGLAKTMGADVTIDSTKQDLKEVIMAETGGDGIGRVCEMSGAAMMVNSMFKLLRKGGSVVMVGLPKQPMHIDDVLPDIVFKSLQLRTVHGRRIFHTWEETEKLLAAGKIRTEPVISHRIPMSQFEEAFTALFSGQACKIVIDPQQ